MAAISSFESLFSVWRGHLAWVLAYYEERRQHIQFFFPKLFIFFFVLNVLCYWLAISTAFPDRAFGPDWLRYTYIQLPVGILGAVFDSFSFYITVYIIRRALLTRTRTSFLAHLSIDFFIAVLATMWVLIVFSVSTWAVDTFVLYDRLPAPRPAAATPTAKIKPAIPAPAPTANPTPAKGPSAIPSRPPKLDRADYLARRSGGYGKRFSDALRDPFAPQNLKNIYFGLLMGASAMLPSLLHVALSLFSILLVMTGIPPKRSRLPAESK